MLTEVINMLTDRQLLILQKIIDDFTEHAHPVGSRAISKKESVNLSAATVRNVMADLEELGFLEKMHSSSGRVPSESGYRYYVDHVISPTLKDIEESIIKKMITDELFEFEHVVETSAQLLSKLTNYTSIILGQNVTQTKLRSIQILPLTQTTAVAILVTDTGHVEHKTFTVPESVNVQDLEKMVNILKERLIGVPIHQLEYKLKSEVYHLMSQHIKHHDLLYEYLQNTLSYEPSAKLYVGGQTNLLMQPEFNDVEAIYDLLTLLDDEEQLIDLLSNQNHKGLSVTIGKENEIDAIKNLSLITTPFDLGLGQHGTIALLGPTRMKYRKVIQLLHALSRELTDIFNLDELE